MWPSLENVWICRSSLVLLGFGATPRFLRADCRTVAANILFPTTSLVDGCLPWSMANDSRDLRYPCKPDHTTALLSRPTVATNNSSTSTHRHSRTTALLGYSTCDAPRQIFTLFRCLCAIPCRAMGFLVPIFSRTSCSPSNSSCYHRFRTDILFHRCTTSPKFHCSLSAPGRICSKVAFSYSSFHTPGACKGIPWAVSSVFTTTPPLRHLRVPNLGHDLRTAGLPRPTMRPCSAASPTFWNSFPQRICQLCHSRCTTSFPWPNTPTTTRILRTCSYRGQSWCICFLPTKFTYVPFFCQ